MQKKFISSVRSLAGAAALVLAAGAAAAAPAETGLTTGSVADRRAEIAVHRCARCAAAAGLAGVGGLGVDPRIHPMSGRDQRTWPPDRPFDHLHMKLEITIPDMAEDRFTARQSLTVTPIGLPRRVFEVNAGPGLKIGRVSADGAEASFTHEDGRLHVSLPREIAPGEEAIITIDYETMGPGGGGGGGAGLTWSPDDPATDVFDPMYHAQGQPETNRLWFPCHDFPNERLTSEVIATVPAGFEAISNGRLAAEERGEHTSRFHWAQEKDHAPYLVTLVVGVFDRVDVAERGAERQPPLPMPIYGPVGSAETLRRQFANTAAMIEHFEILFDESYPWDKYAQLYVRDFAAGAMENTSASTFNSAYLDDPEGSWGLESIIAHELAHQWMGDLVTCRSWEHLWLNEGWASFCEAVWAEQKARLEGRSEAEAREAYMEVIRDYALSERATSRLGVPDHAPMASNLYREADDRFGAPNNVYSKGAVTLHMLREMLGDELFWKGARLYLDRHKHGLVETSDFRRAMEDATGRSLEQFFDQWVYRPGHPRLNVDLVWRPGESETGGDQSGELRAVIMQTQLIDGNNPAFAFQLPIEIELPASVAVPVDADEPGDASTHRWTIHIDERYATFTLPLAARPETVRVNPNLAVLANIRVSGDWPEERRRWRPRRHEQSVPAEAPEAEETELGDLVPAG